jgi:hypothetical protein
MAMVMGNPHARREERGKETTRKIHFMAASGVGLGCSSVVKYFPIISPQV